MLPTWIIDAARKLGEAFQAQRVLVFGSHARGTATRRSDLDLFVLCETELRPLDRIEKALRLLRDLPVAVEPIVYTPHELERRSASKFLQTILREGVIAYER